jgi:hypothetical protein
MKSILTKSLSTLAVALLFPLFSLSVQAQDRAAAAVIKAVEDSLLLTADSMYYAVLPEERILQSEKFARQLVRALKVRDSWSYPFDKLAKKINILYPDGKAFRIFNWAIALTDITRRYYGAIQVPSEQLKLYGLVDHSNELGKGAPDSVLTGGKWMGGIYYRIIPKEVDGRTLYTLFGHNAASQVSTRKFLDVLEMTPAGPRFGAQIFDIRSENFPTRRVNRFVLEYKKDVQASMNWDTEMNAIFFDRLASQVNDPNRKYTFIPSGQYDGFRWDGRQWQFVQDLIPVLQLKDGEAPIGQPR